MFTKWFRDKKDDQILPDWPKYAEQLEHTVEDVRRVAAEAHKGITQNILINKANKKYPEQKLATVLKETTDKLSGEDKLFVPVAREAADALLTLVNCHRDFETQVYQNICEPLNRLSEETCSSISKQRRNLTKLVGDVRTAREQLQKAVQSANGNAQQQQQQQQQAQHGLTTNSMGSVTISPSTGSSDPNSRVNQAQNQLDGKEYELTSCKDQLLRDLYVFASDEEGYANLLLEYFQLQEIYLTESLTQVRKIIPELKESINKRKLDTCFGRHLTDHLTETGRTISYVLETCVNQLDREPNLQEEGLFRKPGSQKKTDLLVANTVHIQINKDKRGIIKTGTSTILTHAIDTGHVLTRNGAFKPIYRKALNIMQADEQLLSTCDCSVVAGALKQYLVSLPEPLITYKFAEQWAAASKVPGSNNIQLIEQCVQKMPQDFRLNLGYLFCYLAKLSAQSGTNKMTTDNLSIVLAPNLYRLPNQRHDSKGSTNNSLEELGKSLNFLQNSGPGIHLCDLLIEHADRLFGAEQAQFRPSLPKPSNMNLTNHSRNPSVDSSSDLLQASRTPNLSIVENHKSSDNIHPGGDLASPADGSESFGRHSSINANSTPNTTRRAHLSQPSIPRKKTAAPKPPVPTALPASLVIAASPPTCLTNDSQNLDSTNSQSLSNDSSITKSDNSLSFTSSQHDHQRPPHPKLSKEPPRRPPPPGAPQKISYSSGGTNPADSQSDEAATTTTTTTTTITNMGSEIQSTD